MTFYELEKKCKQRRLKKYLYIVLIVIIFIAIGIFLFFFNTKTKHIHLKNNSHKISKKKTNLVENNITISKTKSVLIVNPNKNLTSNIKKKSIKVNIKENNKTNLVIKTNLPKKTLSKIIVVTKKDNNKSKKVEKKSSNVVILSPIIPEIAVTTKKNSNYIKPINKETKVVIAPSNIKENNQNSIVQVESLPSYSKCINIAKRYLRKKRYKLALKWAKNANIQNKDLPDSWIVTAKALFYSGNKEKAIEILKVYLSYKDNKEMKKLLRKFENEKNNN